MAFDETNVNRQPEGTGRGGEFANKDSQRWEAGQVVDLWSEDEGNFEFPPRPKTAADVVAFWRKVEIPASAARAVDSRQRIRRQEFYDNHRRGFVEAWKRSKLGDPPPNSDTVKSLEYWQKSNKFEVGQNVYEAAHEDAVEQTNERYPMFEQGYVYPTIRAAMMYEQAKYLPEEERDKVWDAPIRLPEGVSTPAKVHAHYDFDGLRDEMVNPEARSVEALENMSARLNQLAELERKRERDKSEDEDYRNFF